MYVYRATCVRVVDGDTVILDVDVGFHMRGKISFRLFGIDAPEMVGASKADGEVARTALQSILAQATGPLRIETYKADSFGRWLADIYLTLATGGELHVNSEMVRLGHAVWKTY
ncbi:MAG TPA: thermonuclease family protein [Terriglobales bacterium]|nr:thermonuclease family protein [Terriglobales bacterium]